MEYSELAEAFIEQMHLLRKFKPQRIIHESMHGEAFMLHNIATSENHMIPSELSSAMGISGARIAATLNVLESKGYINRQIDPSDRRRILVTLTEKGKEKDNEHRVKLIDMTEKMLRLLGEEDAKEYVRITKKLGELAGNDC